MCQFRAPDLNWLSRKLILFCLKKRHKSLYWKWANLFFNVRLCINKCIKKRWGGVCVFLYTNYWHYKRLAPGNDTQKAYETNEKCEAKQKKNLEKKPKDFLLTSRNSHFHRSFSPHPLSCTSLGDRWVFHFRPKIEKKKEKEKFNCKSFTKPLRSR